MKSKSKKRLLWKLYPSYLIIILLAVIATGWYASHTVRKLYLHTVIEDLEVRGRFALREIQENFPYTGESSERLHELCKTLHATSSARITVMDVTGRILEDSQSEEAKHDNHANRPEMKEALQGKIGVSVRLSHSLNVEMVYVALPVQRMNRVDGVLRLSIPLTQVNLVLRELALKISLGGLTVALLAALITLILSKRVSEPITQIRSGAERYAAGDFSQKIYTEDSSELGELADAMNRMAIQLDGTIRSLTVQRREQQAILSSMREGVIAVDSNERVLFVNHTAESLLNVDSERMKGKLMQEVIRHSELQKFIQEVFATKNSLTEREILLSAEQQQVLQLSGTMLRDEMGQQIGALVVLNDATRLKKLENVRKDFVANVSHELKTPITTIKGFVETLREGALEEPQVAKQFLERILQNTDRLNAIIDDLLSLSVIEQGSEKETIKMSLGDIKDVILAAAQACEAKALARKVFIVITKNDSVPFMMNSTLLEQAVVNLLDNAIKYSTETQNIELELQNLSNEAIIRVRDFGVGIESEYLPRLFERFYRVDKARSRKLGGTGLGLAIVKHIAQAHHGHVDVESTLGKGSVFSLHLPLY